MLYSVFTVDGDWREYFDTRLSEEERFPKEGLLLDMIQREIDVANSVVKGRFIHFIHTSPRARDFFIGRRFLTMWKEIKRYRGDTGLHCHEDDPYQYYYYHDKKRMKKVLSECCRAFRKSGLHINCYRSGFLGFSNSMVHILEENKIYFDFSCEPGRFLTHNRTIICDWRDAPEQQYRMSYVDYSKSGDSKVWEIPIGTSKGKYLYFEKSSLEDLEKIVLDLNKKSSKQKIDIAISVLTHTYEYQSLKQAKAVEQKLNILKNYSTFVNLGELMHILG